jgi:pyruvyl transferase EpsO
VRLERAARARARVPWRPQERPIRTREPLPTDDLVARQRELLLEILAPLVPIDRPYALLDYPAYANVGDNAIWLGTLEAFRRLGAGPPAYTCCIRTYDADSLRRRVGAGPLFVKGGGNFGDLYPLHQAFRERLVRDFPGNPIVQLPQTLRFDDEAALTTAREALAAHAAFTLLVRDRDSLALGRDRLGLRTLLAPDLALALPVPTDRPVPTLDVLWLLRADDEAEARPLVPPDGSVPVDWPADPRGRLARVQRRLTRRVAASPREGLRARRLRRTYDPLAARRLAAGYALLSSARFVVTDRLHGHLLCVLLGIPHVLLDNRYGKNRTLFDAWTRDAPLVRWAERDTDAVAHALADLRRAVAS